jgi:hypothetical protein
MARFFRTHRRPFPIGHSVQSVSAGLVCLHRRFLPGISRIERRTEFRDFP